MGGYEEPPREFGVFVRGRSIVGVFWRWGGKSIPHELGDLGRGEGLGVRWWGGRQVGGVGFPLVGGFRPFGSLFPGKFPPGAPPSKNPLFPQPVKSRKYFKLKKPTLKPTTIIFKIY